MGSAVRFSPASAFVASAFLLVAGAAPASARDLVTAGDVGTVLDIAKGFGSAELEDTAGDPKISGRMEGIKYVVLFYGCTDGKDCQTIQFYAGWDTEPGAVDVDDLNTWNRDNRFSKAYIDGDGDPAIEMDVSLERGVSYGNLDEWFSWWKTSITSFKQKIID